MLIECELLQQDSPLVETVLTWHWDAFSRDHADADLDQWRVQLRGRCRADGIPFTLVARLGDEPVGCITVCHDDADARFADRGPWLSGVVVVGRARNLGVGRRMLDAAADRARQVGATELWLHTGAAARFYERCGYELAHVKQELEDDAVLWLAL